MNKRKQFKLHWLDSLTLIGLILTVVLLFFGYQRGLFESRESFILFIKSYGVMSIGLFILIQLIQVVLPILPAALTCTAGVIIFGPYLGLLYNYVGICAGSILAFLIAKRYGKPVVQQLVSKKKYDKYYGRIQEGNRFSKLLALAIVAPVAPDDVLCYIAGLTDMSLRKFSLIILLGKPPSIALYSLGWTAIVNWLNIV